MSGQVKNKNPAPIQITAEQILREAKERQDVPKPPKKERVLDHEELEYYRLQKRKTFEDNIRRNRNVVSNWTRYADWEAKQGEFERARSIFNRGIDNDPTQQSLWLRYLEMELKQKNINKARNIFDRVVAILPRVDVFWYKWVYMEEMLENVAGARLVFDRWMDWEPSEDAFMAYVKFEKRYHELDKARDVFKRFVSVYPNPKNWLKWARFEESIPDIDSARLIYEKCIETIGEENVDQNVFVSFAKFETRQKELERARAIYKYALDKLPKSQAANLYNEYVLFEKQFGETSEVEDVVITKRRAKYQADLELDPRNYDLWFDFIRLEMDHGDVVKIRDTFEKAIAQTPPIPEKRYWKRYIYTWLFYAVYEEADMKDLDRAKQIYEKCLSIIPHQQFTFAKVWLMYAQFLIRQKQLGQARKLLGASLGKCPKDRLFKGYIELELKLREFDRARKLYEKYLEWNPSNVYAWIKYSEMESMLGDSERARGIFEIAVAQDVLDIPEVLWKAYIDYEVAEAEHHKARALYERLLQKTQHVKIWISYAGFESTCGEETTQLEKTEKARKIFERANQFMKENNAKVERTVLLEAWKSMEDEYGTKEQAQTVQALLPKVVKKRRKNEESNVWEEYFDYVFPDDQADKPNLKLLQMAQEWKKKQQQTRDQ